MWKLSLNFLLVSELKKYSMPEFCNSKAPFSPITGEISVLTNYGQFKEE